MSGFTSGVRGSAWIKSDDIDVEEPRRPYGAGYVIPLSSDGSTLAISAKYEDRGLVQVYAVESNINAWVQRVGGCSVSVLGVTQCHSALMG